MNERLRIEQLPKSSDNSSLHPKINLLSVELTEEQFDAHRPKKSQNAWQLEWRDAAHAKHSDWVGVVAEHHRSARIRTPPQALLAVGDLPVMKIHANVGIEEAKL